MKTRSLLFTLGMVLCTSLLAQPLKTKNIDNGGTGMFKAIAVKESGMPDFVIYRPKDLMHAHARCGALPLLMFANGGCMDTSIGYERMLTEIASHGYIVMAIGEMQDVRNDRKESHTPSSELKRGLDWIVQQSVTKGSDYYQNIDTARIGAAGHSCGGAQVLANAADARLKTYLILNAGMGDMEMAGASKASLPNMHGPALYIVGGPSDVAFENAQKDYERITDTPVALADHPASGHGGTYEHPYGGDYGRMVIDWLDWQLKGEKAKAAIFLDGKLDKYEGWTIKAKNFKQHAESNVEELWIRNGERHLYGVLSRPAHAKGKMPVAIIAHGFNGTHHFGRNYFETLNKLGYQVYTFDFACGSVNSRSDNNTMNMSILDEQSDLEAIVRYFKQQPDVDASRIVLIGESQGGLVSALTAASMPKDISRTILIFPALCIPDNWTARYPNLSDIPDTTRLWNVPMGRRFFNEVRDIDVFKRIGKYKRPVLIVQGDKDPVVSMKDSERAVKIYKDARLHVIPGAGHGFKPKEFEESLQQITLFLKED
ncbi:MAG: alpha/beta fold hydrolase [Bacteroidaceae bacterium]|nr:alpha/beta fold hydrolase [Bacteroidaceae bacterium]